MQNVHYLNRHNDHNAPSRFPSGSGNAEFQILAAIDHVFEDMVDGVLMHARAVSDDFPHFAPNASQETRSAGTRFVSRIVGKDAPQIAIIDGRQIEIVTLTLALIMFPERCLQRREWLHLGSRSVLRFRPRQRFHRLVDVFKLV